MKKIFLILLLSCCIFTAWAQDFPAKPNTLLNDYTQTLNAEETKALESKLLAFNDSTSSQISICILKSVGEYDINEYALELGRRWGVGQKGQNNGIMIVAALGDRKISIQTGYGLEGALPDMLVKRIIETSIVPNFKEGKYYIGLNKATDEIIQLTKGEYKAPKVAKAKDGGPAGFIILIIIVVVIMIIVKKGGGNNDGGVISGRGGSGLAEALLWGVLAGRNSGGNSGWGGGGSSGGGGGFGGFGGGSFGGGGSSGSW